MPFIVMLLLIVATGAMLVRTKDVERQIGMWLMTSSIASAAGGLLTLALSALYIQSILPLTEMRTLSHHLVDMSVVFFSYIFSAAACFIAARSATRRWFGADRRTICICISFCCLSYLILR